MNIPKLLTINEVAEMTGLPVNTLRWWRHKGDGPRGAKFGGRVMYREQDVIDWINKAFEDDGE